MGLLSGEPGGCKRDPGDGQDERGTKNDEVPELVVHRAKEVPADLVNLTAEARLGGIYPRMELGAERFRPRTYPLLEITEVLLRGDIRPTNRRQQFHHRLRRLRAKPSLQPQEQLVPCAFIHCDCPRYEQDAHMGGGSRK